ncbi:copper resistance CopC family protein [uncultured Cellulomonas sp.]|uniref:copper resistance CopC family protein n=1 Tax=uncultured Cellulomonas sp. TaxID=189682 RepID=UPI00262F0C31|nr:copper resistance CopC family protein [uncultured Cellulomonas sp.]
MSTHSGTIAQPLTTTRPRGAARAHARAATLAALLWVWTALLVPQPAAAHTELTGSDPAAGSSVSELPAAVTLTFNDTVAPQFATVAVAVAGGDPVEVPATVDGAQVLADISTLDTTAQGAGAWQVVYRVVAADGHPITGTIDFTVTVTAPAPELEPATPTTPTPTDPAPAVPEPSAPAPTLQPAAPVDADDTEAQEGDSESGLGVAVGLASLVVAVVLITVAAILARRMRSQ